MGTVNREIVLFDTSFGSPPPEPISALKHGSLPPNMYSTGPQLINAVAFSSDGKTLASAFADVETIRLWDTIAAKHLVSLTDVSLTNVSVFSTVFLAFSYDDSSLITSTSNSTIIWDIESRSKRETIKFGPNGSHAIAILPDGKTLAIGTGKHVRLLDIKTGNVSGSLEGHKEIVMAVAMSPDGKTLASGSLDGIVRLWNIESFQELTSSRLHSDGILCLDFSPDGKKLAMAACDTVKVFELESLRGDRHAKSASHEPISTD